MGKHSLKDDIAQAFRRQVSAKGFKSVSVGDIVMDCECSRASFYYHFKDKYDVALWVFVTELAEVWRRDSGADWLDLMEDVLQILKDDSGYYLEVLAYDGQNSLTEFARTSFSEYAAESLGCKISDLSVDVRYAVSIFIGGLMLAWRDWLKGADRLSTHDFAVIIWKNVPKELFYTAGGPLPVDPVDFLVACYQQTRG